jgi:uncharacterized membrane protein (DUF2068 family)
MDWSLRGCGRHGHVTYAPDEPDLRAQLAAENGSRELWQCLRCGTFVPGPPSASGPAAADPVVLRGREIRSRLILRVFSVERFVRALIFLIASIFLWRFRSSHTSIEKAFDRELPVLRGLFRQLGFNIDHSKLVGLVREALTLSSHSITLLAIGAAAYAAVEVVEGVGLWQARRWGEYFAFVATSLGLPLEIYDLTRKVTVTALVLLGVNLALVLYLAITKRLFGIRGGKRAYDARLRQESVLEAAAVAAQGGPAGDGAAPAGRSAASSRGASAVMSPDGASADGADGAPADPTPADPTADDPTADDPAADDRPAEPAMRNPGAAEHWDRSSVDSAD